MRAGLAPGAGSNAASSRLSACRQPRRRLAGQQMRSRVDPLQFAAEAEQVQVGLENLRPSSTSTRCARAARACTSFCVPAAAAAASDRSGIDHRRQLHRDRAGAAASLTGQVVAQRTECRAPVDAVVTPEAVVFAVDHRVDQRRAKPRRAEPTRSGARRSRSARDRSARRVDRADTPPTTASARAPCRSRARRRLAARRSPRRPTQSRRCRRCAATTSHGVGSTTTGWFGRSPNISGAYIASTRVGGSWKVPGLFRRTVYSVLKRPFGTNR